MRPFLSILILVIAICSFTSNRCPSPVRPVPLADTTFKFVGILIDSIPCHCIGDAQCADGVRFRIIDRRETPQGVASTVCVFVPCIDYNFPLVKGTLYGVTATTKFPTRVLYRENPMADTLQHFYCASIIAIPKK
jgi:hypothetical protein